jgi:hypothetical protein
MISSGSALLEGTLRRFGAGSYYARGWYAVIASAILPCASRMRPSTK